MKKTLITLLITCSFLTQMAAADALEKAKELMTIMAVTKQLDASQQQIVNFIDQMIDSQGLSPSEATEAKALAKKSMESSFETMMSIDWESMFADIYASVFSEDEIQALIDFYSSPAGKKFLDKQPELMTATMQKLQGEMAKLMPRIQADVSKAIEKAKKGSE